MTKTNTSGDRPGADGAGAPCLVCQSRHMRPMVRPETGCFTPKAICNRNDTTQQNNTQKHTPTHAAYIAQRRQNEVALGHARVGNGQRLRVDLLRTVHYNNTTRHNTRIDTDIVRQTKAYTKYPGRAASASFVLL